MATPNPRRRFENRLSPPFPSVRLRELLGDDVTFFTTAAPEIPRGDKLHEAFAGEGGVGVAVAAVAAGAGVGGGAGGLEEGDECGYGVGFGAGGGARGRGTCAVGGVAAAIRRA